MKILVICQYFFPEEFKVNDLVEGFINRGHQVTVLTGKPNYPRGLFYSGYRFWGIVQEDYKGAKVIRVPLFRRGNGGALRLVLNYLSFVFFGNWYIRTHTCDYDSILVYQLSPITMAIPAIKAKQKSGATLSLYVQDLWPESVSAASSFKSSFIMNILNRMVRSIYSSTDIILVQSREFEKSICAKGDFSDRIVYVPNWAEDVFVNKSLIDKKRYEDLFPDGFIVMFAGNIGEAQDFDSIIKAAVLLKDQINIKWLIIGDGRAREKAIDRVKEAGIEQSVLFLGRYPVQEMPSFFYHADAMLVSLKRDYIFSLTIPSKVQAYMASGKPIIAMIDGEGRRVVEEARCGMAVSAEDYVSLSKAISKMSTLSREERAQMGINGSRYYQESFDKNAIIDKIVQVLLRD